MVAKNLIYGTLIYMALHRGQRPNPIELITKGIWAGGYNSDGSKQYIRPADYMRDVTGFIQDPIGTIRGKMQAGVGLGWELLNNQDYWGNLIRTPGEPQKWPGEIASFVGQNMLPYSLQQISQGTSAAGKYGQFFGYTLTPQRLSRTKAELDVANYFAQHPFKGATPEQSALIQKRAQALQKAREGDMAGFEKDIQTMRKTGEISKAQEYQLRKRAKEGDKLYRFERLPLDVAIKAYSDSTKAEKKIYREALYRKWMHAHPETKRKNWKQFEQATREGVR